MSYNLRTTCGTKEELPYDTTGVVDDSIIMQRRLRKRVGGGGGCCMGRNTNGWRAEGQGGRIERRTKR